jgi:23S rRNA (uracil1939-C5)-methyltransferase
MNQTMEHLPGKKGIKVLQDIELTDIHSAGKTIAKVGNRNIYVDHGIPGEIVELEVKRRQKQGTFTVGNISKIIKKSENRVDPFCTHSGICGGCNWQHIKYEAQLGLKKKILVRALEKYEINSPEVPEVVPSPNLKHYRNKLDFAFSHDGWYTSEAGNERLVLQQPVIGFHPANHPNEVFDVTECFLQHQKSIEMAHAFKKYATDAGYSFYNFYEKTGLLHHLTIRTTTRGDIMVIVGFNENDKEKQTNILNFLQHQFPEITSLFAYENVNADSNQLVHISGKRHIHENIGALTFQVGPLSFFQPNPEQTVNLYQKIREYAMLSGREFIYDLYTGAGTIACYLSESATRITGIEGNANAVADAVENAKLNNLNNLNFITGDILETFTPDFVSKHGIPDVIILDPPRSGTLIEIKKTMLWANPEKIIYVSCNPVSLAWDLKQLTEKYEVAAIQPFDMFPHTHHVETVVLLERKKPHPNPHLEEREKRARLS